MVIDKKYIDEIKRIFSEKYGREFSDEEAEESCTNLMELARICVDFQVNQIRKVCHGTCPIWRSSGKKLI